MTSFKGLMVFLFFLSFLNTPPAHGLALADNQPSDHIIIKDFEIQSENTELNELIFESAQSFIGQFSNEKNLAQLKLELHKSLIKNKYYATQIEVLPISITGTVTVLLTQPLQYIIEYNKVSILSWDDLFEFLNLKEYSTTNPNIQYDLAQKIKQFYLQKGYARIEVKFIIKDLNRFKRNIQFDINVGPRVKINSIKFNGQFSNPSDYYQNELIKYGAGQLLKKGYYNKEDIEKALENVMTSLWNKGYLKANAKINRAVFSKDHTHVDIFILFYEGEQTYLKNIKIEGASSVSSQLVLNYFNLKQGQALSLSELEKAIDNLTQYYHELGFLEMHIVNYGPELISYENDFKNATLNIQIFEGPLIIVDHIQIKGLTFTKSSVIFNELDFKTSDILTKTKLSDSEERLLLTGLFRGVRITYDPKNSLHSKRNVIIEVIEKDPGLFNFGIGAHNERYLSVRGFLGLSYQNLFGTARSLSMRMDGQYNLQGEPFFENSIRANYTEPYLFETRIRGKIGISRSTLITDYNNLIASESNQTSYTLEQYITPKFLLKWRLWQITSYRDFYITNHVDANQLQIADTQLAYEYDLRDHPFNPNKGVYTHGYYEYASPQLASSDWIGFNKINLNLSHYVTLFDIHNFVLASSVRYGYLSPTSDSYLIPYDKIGFFMGGHSTLRSFNLNESFPSTTDLGGSSYRLNSWAQLKLIKVELRIPIWKQIGSAVFLDMGDIVFGNNAFTSGWRKGVGIAFRYLTPVGAVSFEYAWKLPPFYQRNESEAALHFSIGTF